MTTEQQDLLMSEYMKLSVKYADLAVQYVETIEFIKDISKEREACDPNTNLNDYIGRAKDILKVKRNPEET